MHQKLFALISESLPLTPNDMELCKQYIEPISVCKNTVLEEQGNVPKHLYFVVSGFVRLFSLNSKGDEVTTHINCPPGFITSYTSFITQTPSSEKVGCITDCELLRVTKGNLDLLNEKSTLFKDFSILVFQQSLAYNEKRSKELATLTAEERYIKLITEQPEILQAVPIQYIASFLGMNPKSLSRIRKQIVR